MSLLCFCKIRYFTLNFSGSLENILKLLVYDTRAKHITNKPKQTLSYLSYLAYPTLTLQAVLNYLKMCTFYTWCQIAS